jgi:hypothetical protein
VIPGKIALAVGGEGVGFFAVSKRDNTIKPAVLYNAIANHPNLHISHFGTWLLLTLYKSDTLP